MDWGILNLEKPISNESHHHVPEHKTPLTANAADHANIIEITAERIVKKKRESKKKIPKENSDPLFQVNKE